MIHPDKQVLQALSRLVHQDDYKTVRTWLESELTNISRNNDSQLDEVLLRRGQGAALLLREFLKVQDDAEETLTKIRDNAK